MIASGTRITPIVLNCRFKYAIAPSWIAMRDLLHLLGALVGGEHTSHQEEADPEREQRGCDRGEQDQPLTSVQVEGLVAAFGGQYVRHFSSPGD